MPTDKLRVLLVAELDLTTAKFEFPNIRNDADKNPEGCAMAVLDSYRESSVACVAREKGVCIARARWSELGEFGSAGPSPDAPWVSVLRGGFR